MSVVIKIRNRVAHARDLSHFLNNTPKGRFTSGKNF